MKFASSFQLVIQFSIASQTPHTYIAWKLCSGVPRRSVEYKNFLTARKGWIRGSIISQDCHVVSNLPNLLLVGEQNWDTCYQRRLPLSTFLRVVPGEITDTRGLGSERSYRNPGRAPRKETSQTCFLTPTAEQPELPTSITLFSYPWAMFLNIFHAPQRVEASLKNSSISRRVYEKNV